MSQPARILAGVLGVAQVLAQPGLLAQAQATIHALPTSDTALVGRFVRGPMNLALRVSAAEFDATFGSGAAASWPAEAQARWARPEEHAVMIREAVKAAGLQGMRLAVPV